MHKHYSSHDGRISMDASLQMESWILVFVACFVQTFMFLECGAEKNFTVTKDTGGFNVSISGNLVLSHTPTSPIMYVGQGKTVFREALGNFHIRSYIQERVGLHSFNYTSGNGNADYIVLSNGPYKVTVTLETTMDQDMVLSVQNNGIPFSYSWIRLVAEPDEQIYGGGEQFTHVNLRKRTYTTAEYFSVLRADDQTYPMWTREQGVGRDKSTNVTFFADLQGGGGGDFSTTYFPQPSFVSSKKYYFHFTTTSYMVVDLSVPTFHEVFVKGDFGEIYFKSAPTLLGVVQELSDVLGRMPELPEWTYDGIIMGVQGGTETMMKRYNDAKKAGVRIRGLWIQDWSGTIKTSFGQRVFWDWKWNQDRYPGLDKKIQELKEQGVRVTVYINPNLNTEGNLFAEAHTNGYLVKNSSNQTYRVNFGEFYCGIVDLTNPNAYNWYKGKMTENMINLGLGGWMADFGEYLPTDAKLNNGKTGEQMHNKWPVLWAKLNRETVEEANKLGEIVFWMRAGYTGTSNYSTLMWAGDQNVDFSIGDGMPSTIPAALSMGISGAGITHFDTGCYTTFGQLGLKRSPELLLRSAEMAVFTPVMRTHEGNQPSFNAQMYDANMLPHFKRLVAIHQGLANYTAMTMRQYTDEGVPMQRPLFLAYENDTNARGVKYQYMYGPDLLVAPVLTPNAETRDVYLPQGNWVYVWNNTAVPSGKITVNAPIGFPPAFYKKNSNFESTFKTFADFEIPIVTKTTPSSAPQSPSNCGAVVFLSILTIMISIFITIKNT